MPAEGSECTGVQLYGKVWFNFYFHCDSALISLVDKVTVCRSDEQPPGDVVVAVSVAGGVGGRIEE